MGQKVNPNGLRIGVIGDWSSHWYSEKQQFADCLIEDQKIREFVMKAIDPIARKNSKKPVDEARSNVAFVSKVIVDRKGADNIRVTIKTARPSLVGGDKGSGRVELKEALEKEFNKNLSKDQNKKVFTVDVEVIKTNDTDALLVAQSIASQLENRASFRRAMKRAMQLAMKQPDVLGIKTKCSGRLGGAEIARSETYHEGTIPLQTLRADIDYGFAEANTTYGRIGVKVWIYKGEKFARKSNPSNGEGGKA